MRPESCDEYQTQGWLSPGEAKRILPRLELEKIRFQIQADHSGRPQIRSPSHDSRIELFVHSADVEAWLKIRQEYFPG